MLNGGRRVTSNRATYDTEVLFKLLVADSTSALDASGPSHRCMRDRSMCHYLCVFEVGGCPGHALQHHLAPRHIFRCILGGILEAVGHRVGPMGAQGRPKSLKDGV